jgi:spore germination protein
MKKTVFITALVVALGISAIYVSRFPGNKNQRISLPARTDKEASNLKINTPTSIKTEIVSRSIFLPYWQYGNEFVLDNTYDRVIFFDPDMRSIDDFSDRTKQREYEKYLAIKVSDQEDLKEETKNRVITIVKKNNLKGIVLDLEIPIVFGDKNKQQINEFVKQFYTETKQNYKSFSLILYGDIFYRKRGYDLSYLNEYADEIMIMAYDFHKASGEPGPNFQFGGKDKYDYDFQQMIEDYLRFVPREKITVIFGMYGYDWTVDEKKRPIKPAEALTLNQVKQKFLDSCQWKNCLVSRDSLSKETEVDYVVPYKMEDGVMGMEYHIVWFEDIESVKAKTEYLREKGIGKVAYWGYGYF